MNVPGARLLDTAYTVSILPIDNIYRNYLIEVRRVPGTEMWEVTHLGAFLNADMKWDLRSEWWSDFEGDNSWEEWARTHRFSFLEAIQKARDVAPFVEVNGRSATEALQRSLQVQEEKSF